MAAALSGSRFISIPRHLAGDSALGKSGLIYLRIASLPLWNGVSFFP